MSLVPDPPINAYTPFFRPGVAFVTWWALDGEPVLGQPATANLLRSVLRAVKATWTFQMLGYVFLPDHVHLLIRPHDKVSAGQIVDETKRRYRQQYPQLMGIPAAIEVWDRRHAIELVREAEEFARRLDEIHYDPVHHGWVERPEEWAQSSYGAWIERGLYKLGWGWQKPVRLGEE